MITSTQIEQLFDEQLHTWELARCNYAALDNIMVRHITVDNCDVTIQFNPCRVTSATTNIKTCNERPCFLCDAHLPQEQLRIPLSNEYQVLVNPYPIFRHHFTISSLSHTPQRIGDRVGYMLSLVQSCSPYTIFYNGPYSGASAPMHMHFQAAESGIMPIEWQWKVAPRSEITRYGSSCMYNIENMKRAIIAIEGERIDELEKLFERLYKSMSQLSINKECEEPMMNIIARYEEGRYILLVFPRAKHRPDCYYASGSSQHLISPGSVEMGGLFITVREEDFTTLTSHIISDIYQEISLSQADIHRVLSHINEEN